jgi:microcystin-dependent protein
MAANLFGDDALEGNPPSVRAGLGDAEFFMSEMTLLAATKHHPSNWAPAEGQLIPINQNEALYDLIGTTYGGDGMHNFALPNLKDLGPGGVRYYICLYGLCPGGEAPE